MKKRKPHISVEQKQSTQKSYWKKGRSLFATGIILTILLIILLLYNSTLTSRKPSVASTQPKSLQEPMDSNLFLRIVKRTYAISKLFYSVYNAEWESANGAIGDAFFYAATQDENILSIYTNTFKLTDMRNGTWVDDRAWVCLAEKYWWQFTGKKNIQWVNDAKKRYLEARHEGRLSHHEGFWSWYNYGPNMPGNYKIFTNTNMNQMATIACWLYETTHEKQFYSDALLIWNGDKRYPGVEKKFYRGNGVWEGASGKAAFGKQFPWEGAGMCTIGAALFQMTGEKKYKDIVVATAKRIMDPANGWIDPQDFYQLRMDGNGAFVHFILDAYQIAPELLSDIPMKIEKMLEHVWSNHHGTSRITLHRPIDDGIRNGWNPNGGEDGYNVNEIGTVHAQSQALLAFGVFAYILKTQSSSLYLRTQSQ
jgi:hypothetical protein